MKKIYDLSVHTQMADDQRILKADSGKEYNVSFRPAILNRKYYKRWQEIQNSILLSLTDFIKIQGKVNSKVLLTADENKKIVDFKELANEAAGIGTDLIIYAIKINGYEEFSEDELYINFSENSISLAIDFIMGIDNLADNKKKVISRTKRSKAGNITKTKS